MRWNKSRCKYVANKTKKYHKWKHLWIKNQTKKGVTFWVTPVLFIISCLILQDYFTSSYIIGTGYQDFPFLWYNCGTKTRLLLHFFTGNTFKELFAEVRKIFDTQCSFDDLISTLDGRLSGCPPLSHPSQVHHIL